MQSEPSLQGAPPSAPATVASSSATTLELSWPSRLSSVEDAANTIDILVMRLGGDTAMRAAVELALREALTNAIRHGRRPTAVGSKPSPGSTAGHRPADDGIADCADGDEPRVELTVALTPGALELTVRDRGPGFIPGALAAPPRPGGPSGAPGSRGLHRIRQAMDHAEWSPRPGGGTCLHMRKRWA